MFWGVVLKPNNAYKSIVDKSFQVSLVTLDLKSENTDIQVFFCDENNDEFLLANLSKTNDHVAPNLIFFKGDHVSFLSKNGIGLVHITGFYLKDETNSKTVIIEDEKEKEDRLLQDANIKVDDEVIGKGKKVELGKKIRIHYECCAPSIDCCVVKKNLEFELGAENVSKAWEIFLDEMKEGGKRCITCLSFFASEIDGVPPDIPIDSTLIFHINLIKVY